MRPASFLLGGACAAILLVFATAARADFVADTVETLPSGAPLPAIVLDPVTGAPHLAYTVGSGIRHAYRSGGSWAFETVTASGTGLDWAIGPTGRLAAAYVQPGGTIVVARPDGAAWDQDTVAVYPGHFLNLSLVVDPRNDEPVIAWMGTPNNLPPQPLQVIQARHSGSQWIATTVDSFTGVLRTPSLALDPKNSNPRLAYVRLSYGNGPQGLAYVAGSGPDGPFSLSWVDSLATIHVSLALDPSSGDPRIAYIGLDSPEGEYHVNYAWLEGGTWSWMVAGPTNTFNSPFAPVSLVLDASGSPAFVAMLTSPILKGTAPENVSNCGGVETGTVYYASRSTDTGYDPFDIAYLPRLDWDQTNGKRALARYPWGNPRVAYRGPRPTGCTPVGVYYGEPAPPASVPHDAVALSLGAPRPQPLRSGGTVTLPVTLDRERVISLGVYDVAGRCVARRVTERLPAGDHQVRFPLDVPPGVYALRADAGSAGRAVRSLIVLR